MEAHEKYTNQKERNDTILYDPQTLFSEIILSCPNQSFFILTPTFESFRNRLKCVL